MGRGSGKKMISSTGGWEGAGGRTKRTGRMGEMISSTMRHWQGRELRVEMWLEGVEDGGDVSGVSMGWGLPF